MKNKKITKQMSKVLMCIFSCTLIASNVTTKVLADELEDVTTEVTISTEDDGNIQVDGNLVSEEENIELTSENDGDVTPPELIATKLDNAVIMPGGTVQLTIKATDESGFVTEDNGANVAIVTYACNGFMENYELPYYESENVFRGEIQIPESASEGIYRLEYVDLMDISGNMITYSAGIDNHVNLVRTGNILVKNNLDEQWYPNISSNAYGSYTAPFVPKVYTDHGTIEMLLNGENYDGQPITEFGNYNLFIKATGADGSISTEEYNFSVIFEMNNETSNEEVISYILESADNNIMIQLNNDSRTVDSSIFKAIKDSRKTVSFLLSYDQSWTFDGNNINDEDIRDVNLSVSNVSEYENKILEIDENAVIIDFAHNGNLPGKAEVKAYIGYKSPLSNKEVTLYYYNKETGKPEKIKESLYIEYVYGDEYVTFEIDHCNTYFISDKDNLDQEVVVIEPEEPIVPVQPVEPSESENDKIVTVRPSETNNGSNYDKGKLPETGGVNSNITIMLAMILVLAGVVILNKKEYFQKQ